MFCLEASFLCGCQWDIWEAIVSAVRVQTVFWTVGELVSGLRQGVVRPAGKGRTWQAVGTKAVCSVVLTLKNRLCLATKYLVFFIWQTRWKRLINYEKDLWKKKSPPSYICWEEEPEEVTLNKRAWTVSWQDKEMMLRDGLCQTMCLAYVKLRSSTHRSAVLRCAVRWLIRS